MWRGEIVAYMPSLSARRQVRDDTLTDLASTDWAAAAVVVLDRERFDDPGRRATDTSRLVLSRAVDDARGDVLLYLEDDLAFNRHLRFNIEHWPPLVERRLGDHFCGSLYNPNIGSLDPDQDDPTCRVAHPELPYGTQAVLLALTTANWILDRWDLQPGLSDLKIFRLAAERTPIRYHRPSLVQHRPVPSAWGGVAHEAVDYAPDWRADAGTVTDST